MFMSRPEDAWELIVKGEGKAFGPEGTESEIPWRGEQSAPSRRPVCLEHGE